MRRFICLLGKPLFSLLCRVVCDLLCLQNLLGLILGLLDLGNGSLLCLLLNVQGCRIFLQFLLLQQLLRSLHFTFQSVKINVHLGLFLLFMLRRLRMRRFICLLGKPLFSLLCRVVCDLMCLHNVEVFSVVESGAAAAAVVESGAAALPVVGLLGLIK